MRPSTRGAQGGGARSCGGGGDSDDTSKGSKGVRGSCAMTDNGGLSPPGDDGSWCGGGG